MPTRSVQQSSEAILSSKRNKLSRTTLDAMFQYAHQHATTSGTLITPTENNNPSLIIDENGRNITPKNAPFYSTHFMLNYQGKYYILFHPCLYFANQDNKNNPNDPLNRGSREVVLLKDEEGKLFIAKIITVSRTIKDRVLQSANQEMQLAHRFLNAPYSDCFTRKIRGHKTQIFLLQYYKGINLREAIEANVLSLEQKTNIAAQILRIILNLHANGYLHRDIQRQNFVIDKNNSTGFYDVTLIDYGKAVPFDASTGDEISESDVHQNSRYSVYIDIQQALTEINEFFDTNDGFETYCRRIIEEAKEKIATNRNQQSIQTIVANVITEIEDAPRKNLRDLKDAVNEVVAQYIADTSTTHRKKHGLIGIYRAKKLQKACNAALDVASIRTAFNRCFSGGYFSTPRSNDYSLARYTLANQTIVNAFHYQLKAIMDQVEVTETDKTNLGQLGGNRYHFWCSSQENQNQQQSLQKITHLMTSVMRR